MGCIKTTKKILKGVAQAITPALLEYGVTAVSVLDGAGKSSPDVFTNEVKRDAAFVAIRKRWRDDTGVEPKDHLVNLLLEYAVTALRSDQDETTLGADDRDTEPID